MAIKYMTRANILPRGLARVYFCCHHDDLKYLKPICDDVLRLVNCAVYYYEDRNAVSEEDAELELSQMQLFIMPVTVRLLTEDNTGLQDFRFAVSRNIPVLPLLQEGGTDALFNKVCGDLQYLDKSAFDVTAISFEEKLDKYLKTVLIGDGQAQRIRAAFDAYIFLSYRKKDRKYAQELMRLIHANDVCRDIAIWYDEFLTPGENFNDSIKDALDKSRLFVLVVTPNIAEKKNYVMTVEYPMALKAGKSILPAELVKTDLKLIKKRYKGIKNLTDAHDAGVLGSALMTAAEGIALRYNDGDPAHNFLIGLAYLDGVDVEVDCERAAALITDAATAGLPEAMKKLAAMYKNGEGVRRDSRKAIEWQSRLCEYYDRCYSAEPGESSAAELFEALRELGDAKHAAGDNAGAGEVYSRMLALARERGDKRLLLVACNKLFLSACDACDYAGAESYSRDMLGLAEDIAASEGSVRALKELAASLQAAGSMCCARRRTAEAKEYYARALDICKALSSRMGDVKDRVFVALAYSCMGGAATDERNIAEAKMYFGKYMSLMEDIAKSSSELFVRYYLAQSYSLYGLTLVAEKNYDGARALFERSLEIAIALDGEAEDVRFTRLVSDNLINLARLLKTTGDLTAAGAMCDKAMEPTKRVADVTGAPEDMEKLLFMYAGSGEIALARGDTALAKKHYENMYAAASTHGETSGGPYRDEIKTACINLGNIAAAEKDRARAKEYFGEAMRMIDALLDLDGTPELRKDKATCFIWLSNIYSAEGDTAAALDITKQALELFKSVYDDLKTKEDLNNIACTYAQIGDIGKDRDALVAACEIWSSLAERFPEVTKYARMCDMTKARLARM